MSKTILISLLLLNCPPILILGNAQTEVDSAIYWTNDKKLRFEDFQGKVPSDLGTEAAMSNIAFDIKLSSKGTEFSVKVSCYFHKFKSWIRSNVSSVLKHEQLHFDIAEIIAREIRYGVLALKDRQDSNPQNYTNLIRSLQKKFYSENQLYDLQTNHGMNMTEQLKWERKIASDLLFYSDYSINK